MSSLNKWRSFRNGLSLLAFGFGMFLWAAISIWTDSVELPDAKGREYSFQRKDEPLKFGLACAAIVVVGVGALAGGAYSILRFDAAENEPTTQP